MFAAVQDFAYRNVLENMRIEVAELEHAAIYGAAALYFKDK
jgi:hypothetical protein